ncbi:MAG: hypothetical protein Q7S36_00360, partial [Candidatus Liptonbacteria bacterium]|nr:hypothetical protein [Candidatus Liptonbacteria bacterium]
MNSPSIKKLITSFLILATLTSSAVFLLSNKFTGLGIAVNGVPTKISLAGRDVFVESIPSLADYISPFASRSELVGGSGTNITDSFASELSLKLLAANPNG